MPVRVTDIKKLDESECFTTVRSDALIEKIIIFLKKNNADAFSLKEITKGLEDEGTKNIYGRPPTTNSISFALSKILKRKIITTVKKKGNYYWYEENK